MAWLRADDVWIVELDVNGGSEGGPRRRRSTVERRRVAEETLERGALVARVALNHGVNADQVFQWWRRLYWNGKLGGTPVERVRLLPVSVVGDDGPPRPEATEVRCSISSAIHI
jgi:transposase